MSLLGLVVVVVLAGCGDSGSDVSVDNAVGATALSSEPLVSSAPATAAPATTAAAATTAAPTTATTAAPTTAAPTTAAPTTAAPSGPSVGSVTTPSNEVSCDEATAQGNMVTVSWKATGAASITLAIDNPAGAYESGLPIEGSTQIPATCGDSQDVYIIPVAADGTAGTAQKITITVGA